MNEKECNYLYQNIEIQKSQNEKMDQLLKNQIAKMDEIQKENQFLKTLIELLIKNQKETSDQLNKKIDEQNKLIMQLTMKWPKTIKFKSVDEPRRIIAYLPDEIALSV